MDSLIATGIDDEFQQSLMQHFGPLNPYPAGIHEHMALGVPITDAHVVTRDEARKTEFYNDWIRPQGRDIYQLGAKLAKDSTRYAAIVAQPDAPQFERHESDYFELMRLLIPHFTNALRVNRALEGHARTSSGLADAFNRSDIAVLILDQNKRVSLANTVAEHLLSTSDVVSTTPFDGLVARDKSCAQTFATALQACLPDGGLQIKGPIVLKSGANGARHVVWVQSLGRRLSPLGGKTHKLFGVMGAEPALAVFITKIDRDRSLNSEVVATMFGLTPAEGKLAASLANGDSLTSYADRTGVSRNTVRAQLASIFDKTGTSRQAELVSIIWRSMSSIGMG